MFPTSNSLAFRPKGETSVTFSGAVPSFVTVNVAVAVSPTETVPKEYHAGLASMAGRETTPAPATCTGTYVSLLVTDIVVANLPGRLGANRTVTSYDSPGASTVCPPPAATANGANWFDSNDSPYTVNGASPSLVMVTFRVTFAPTDALPN